MKNSPASPITTASSAPVEKVPSDSCRPVEIVQRRSKSHPGEIPSNASAWAARRVGDKLERNPRRLNPRNRVEGARQERVADINDALEVEQYAADGAGISSDRQATPLLHRSHPIAFDGMFRDCRLANSSKGLKREPNIDIGAFLIPTWTILRE